MTVYVWMCVGPQWIGGNCNEVDRGWWSNGDSEVYWDVRQILWLPERQQLYNWLSEEENIQVPLQVSKRLPFEGTIAWIYTSICFTDSFSISVAKGDFWIPKGVGKECQEAAWVLKVDEKDDAPESRNPLGTRDNRYVC